MTSTRNSILCRFGDAFARVCGFYLRHLHTLKTFMVRMGLVGNMKESLSILGHVNLVKRIMYIIEDDGNGS